MLMLPERVRTNSGTRGQKQSDRPGPRACKQLNRDMIHRNPRESRRTLTNSPQAKKKAADIPPLLHKRRKKRRSPTDLERLVLPLTSSQGAIRRAAPTKFTP